MRKSLEVKVCIAVLALSCVAWGWLAGDAWGADPPNTLRVGRGDTCTTTRLVDEVNGRTIVVLRCYRTRPVWRWAL